MNGENQTQNQPQQTETPTSSPKEKNTGMAIIAYIIFFIPLLTDAKKDPFVKFHVKQGLIIFIGWFVIGIIGYILSFIPFVGWMISRLLNVLLFVLMIVGIMNAAKGERKPLPIIGKFAEKFKF